MSRADFGSLGWGDTVHNVRVHMSVFGAKCSLKCVMVNDHLQRAGCIGHHTEVLKVCPESLLSWLHGPAALVVPTWVCWWLVNITVTAW